MVIDVLINSCARPDVLEVSINTFKKHIKTTHELRYVILEDRVRRKERRRKGEEWISKNKSLFDEIHFAEKKMGPGFFFAPIVKLCKSDYFFHLEDDNEFIVDVEIDPVIDLIENNKNIVEIMLNRGQIRKKNNLGNTIVSGIKLIEFDLFSVATGIFNTKLVNKLIGKIGWEEQLHEAGTLTPMSKELNFKKYILGHGIKHYKHIGAEKGYTKGGWKSG